MDRLQIYETRFCPQSMNSYIHNLTSSYTDKSNELSMVSASVIMFVLAGLFFNLNLFSGLSDVSAILDPGVRIFLTSTHSLFISVMSYLFSEAKNAGASSTTAADLPLRASMILAWMLLVELLRKKVDEIRMRGYSGTIQRAGDVAWMGNLIFFNIRTAGRKAVFSILWILCATRVVQRIAYTELEKRSYAHGRNARVINSYMAKMHQAVQGEEMLQHDTHQEVVPHHDVEQAAVAGQEMLKRCKYLVMGEEKLVTKATADGYELVTKATADGYEFKPDDSVITVGKVWELDETDQLFTSREQIQQLKRLCFSFALFKLLRRRFEHLPAAATDKEARECRDLILKGLYNNGEIPAEVLFEVMNDEVNFLCEYYHSVVPVVLASPFFLLVNYFLVLIVVAILCLMTVILCGNGDVKYAFSSIAADNYTLRYGFGNIAMCLVLRARKLPEAFFSIVDFSITVLLFIIYFYEEIWEFFVFLLSNWLMVSLFSNYMAKPHWRESPCFRFTFRRILWLRSMISHSNLSFRQFSALNFRLPLRLPLLPTLSLALRRELVPNNLKQCIIDYLVAHDCGTDTASYTPFTNGKYALRRNNLHDQFSWACESDSVAEVILTWHIATSILELDVESKQHEATASSSRTAIRVSKYCAYLVTFHPKLLPGNPEKAERVVEDMKAELRDMLGIWGYYLSSQHARVKKIKKLDRQNTVVRNGAELGRLLIDEAKNKGPETAWKVLEEVWTELIVFVAPSSDEERLKAHEDVLVQGGEFITVLWALITHTSVPRPADKQTTMGGHQKTLEDLFGESMRVPCPAASVM